MPYAPGVLDEYLDQLSLDSQVGARLPPIRELMRRLGMSQVEVQRALAGSRGPTGQAAAPTCSVLLLRRSFESGGHRMLGVTYAALSPARTSPKGLPRFDACVLWSIFKTIPVDLLAAMRERSAVLAVDGALLVGTDAKAVGMEWGQPLVRALQSVVQHGHRRLAFATATLRYLRWAGGASRRGRVCPAASCVRCVCRSCPMKAAQPRWWTNSRPEAMPTGNCRLEP